MSRDDPGQALAALLAAHLGDEGAMALLALLGTDDPVATLGLSGLPLQIAEPGGTGG